MAAKKKSKKAQKQSNRCSHGEGDISNTGNTGNSGNTRDISSSGNRPQHATSNNTNANTTKNTAKTKNSKNHSKNNSKNSTKNSPNSPNSDLIHVNPSRIRFQHSRIRPYFSGCGRSVMETLEEIRRGDLSPGDLPPIQVIIGPDEHDGLGPWYFSLNNRRLWVLKRCLEEGLLNYSNDPQYPNHPNYSNKSNHPINLNDPQHAQYANTIPVRVRTPKSDAEMERYSLENCAVEAKFMREGNGGGGSAGTKIKKKGKKNGRQNENNNGVGGTTTNEDAKEIEALMEHLNLKEGTSPSSPDSDQESEEKQAKGRSNGRKYYFDPTILSGFGSDESDESDQSYGGDGSDESESSSEDGSDSDDDGISHQNPFTILM